MLARVLDADIVSSHFLMTKICEFEAALDASLLLSVGVGQMLKQGNGTRREADRFRRTCVNEINQEVQFLESTQSTIACDYGEKSLMLCTFISTCLTIKRIE